MKLKIFLMLILTLAITLSLAACGGCKAHVDKDDDLKCDNCGKDYDDGPEAPEFVGLKVNFTVVTDTGAPLSGAKLVLGENNDYTVTLDASGKGSADMLPGIYDVYIEGYLASVEFIKVREGNTEFSITVMDNRPDGSLAKPFYISEKETALTLAPGEEIFFNYRGTSVKYASVYTEGVVITYNGTTYSFDADASILNVCIQPGTLSDPANEDSGRSTVFSVKNTTDVAIEFVLYFEAPEGSSENPFVLDTNERTVTVNYDTEVYYTFTAGKTGTLVLTAPSERNDITLTKIIEGDVPFIVKTEGASQIQLDVKAGDKIIISVSAFAPGADESRDVEIYFAYEIK